MCCMFFFNIVTKCFQSLKALYKFSVHFCCFFVADVNHLGGLHFSDTVI